MPPPLIEAIKALCANRSISQNEMVKRLLIFAVEHFAKEANDRALQDFINDKLDTIEPVTNHRRKRQ